MYIVSTSTTEIWRQHTWWVWGTTPKAGPRNICIYACFSFCGVGFCIILQTVEYRLAMLAQGLYYQCLVENFWNFITFLSFCTASHFVQYIASNSYIYNLLEICIRENIILFILPCSLWVSCQLLKPIISCPFRSEKAQCISEKNTN